MSNPEFLKEQIEMMREQEKCPHCGGDIRDVILKPWQRKAIREAIGLNHHKQKEPPHE